LDITVLAAFFAAMMRSKLPLTVTMAWPPGLPMSMPYPSSDSLDTEHTPSDSD
jgi:hypothetical protein